MVSCDTLTVSTNVHRAVNICTKLIKVDFIVVTLWYCGIAALIAAGKSFQKIIDCSSGLFDQRGTRIDSATVRSAHVTITNFHLKYSMCLNVRE